jgi:hypothetical protein
MVNTLGGLLFMKFSGKCGAMFMGGLALAVAGCSTIQDLRGSSFVPASYGVEALKAVIEDPNVTPVDGEAAARELGNRVLRNQDGGDLLALLALNRHPRINVALLETIRKKEMVYLLSGLQEFEATVGDSDTAVATFLTIAEFLPPDELQEYAEKTLAENRHAAVRYLAVKQLVQEQVASEQLIIDALKRESNAVVAVELCQVLFSIGTEEALEVLSDVGNDVTRTYQADRIDGIRADANTVRISAIQAFEAITEIYAE